jgi:hypothetical protein
MLIGALLIAGFAGIAPAEDASKSDQVALSPAEVNADQKIIKERYIKFLIGDAETFTGTYGPGVYAGVMQKIRFSIEKAQAFDFEKDVGKTLCLVQNNQEEFPVYSPLLQGYLLSLAYGYCVKGIDNPYYHNPEILKTYIHCLDYLYSRGVREGVTFHDSAREVKAPGAPKAENGAGNLFGMRLRMGAYCQSVLLMEPYFRETETYKQARALIRHLEILGKMSDRYYKPYAPPPAFKNLVQCDAMQIYGDVTFVSALLEEDPERKAELLLDAKRVFSDSLKVIPGWADTIKPDFVGFHHQAIYGNAYTGGFIPQASFGVYALNGTHYAVEPQSVENLNNLILTYRLYCQKYSMPFGIRGRFPLMSDNLKGEVFASLLIGASKLGLDDKAIKPVFARIWDPKQVGTDFVFVGGRGKSFRGLYTLNMLDELIKENIVPEPDPSGFWYKPYGGLAIHRRDNWMAAVKGYSKYVWDYENGRGNPQENIYGQYFSHGALTIFSKGNPVSDIDSGYNLNEGWDWYRMPGTTAVHFPIGPQKTLEQRQFSPETFLGGVSVDGQNGLFGMILNQPKFGDGTPINLKANKSVFFVDDTILMLGSGISGGDGKNPVETTVFQSYLPAKSAFAINKAALVDPSGNSYYLPDTSSLQLFQGEQKSYCVDGATPSKGNYAVAWIDHGLKPEDASYEVAIGVRGAARKPYKVIRQDKQLHQVRFPEQKLTGYAFFQPLEIDDPIIGKASEPCLAMVKETADGLRLAVANPDLGLLPRDAATPMAFRSITEVSQYSASQSRPVEITLNGHWELKAPADKVALVSQSGKQTVLRFDCVDGMDIKMELIRK